MFKDLNEKLEKLLEEAAMYKSNLPVFKDFYKYVIKNPKCKKCYFEMSKPSVRIPSDTILHDFKKHHITFEHWQDALSNLHNNYNQIMTLFMDHPNSIDNWILTGSAGGLASQLPASDTLKGSSVTQSSQPPNNIIIYLKQKIKMGEK